MMSVQPKMPICAPCGGDTRLETMTYDLGPLLGLVHVTVENMPLVKCQKCGSVSVFGGILEFAALSIAAEMLSRAELEPMEIRFLRKRLGYTQEDLAQHLGVDRATVNRWEAGPSRLVGTQAYALRSHALIGLEDKSPELFKEVRQVLRDLPVKKTYNQGYRLNGHQLQQSVAA